MTDAAAPPDDIHRDVRAVVAASGSTFTNGMRILPAARRRAIFAVYAFCRVVDDIVDADARPQEKEAGLAFWEREIAEVYGGAPRTPVGRALTEAVRDHRLPQREFTLILEGMRMDVTPQVAPDAESLQGYVRRVAGAVGILSMHVFGAWRGEPSRRFALSLAEAMQLTNILRDVEEDARIGRIYLPREVLWEAGAPADPARIATAPELPVARRALGRAARRAFERAAHEIPHHGRRPLIPALLMMGPYERLLARMEADWSRPPAPRGKAGKAFDGLRCVAFGGCG